MSTMVELSVVMLARRHTAAWSTSLVEENNINPVFLKFSSGRETCDSRTNNGNLTAYSFFSHRQRSPAAYVMMKSAPALFMEVRISRVTAFSSIHPFSEAALTIEYSPET